jgi:acyl-CoA reductase-like NAD-dependent aldehyde dehydrogenase
MNLAELLDQNAERMSQLETTDNGKVIRETKKSNAFCSP